MVKKLSLNFGLKFTSLDLLVISPQKIVLYHVKGGKKRISLESKFEYSGEFFAKSLLYVANLEKALKELKAKHKDLIEAGIILHLPGLIFQKVSLPISKKLQDTLLNYLRSNLPIPLQKYYTFSKVEKQNLLENTVTVAIFFLPKQLIDSLVNVLEKVNIIPLFAIHSFNALDIFALDYFSIESETDYIFIIHSDKAIMSSWIRNYQHFKVLTDEIETGDLDKLQRLIAYYDQIVPKANREFFVLTSLELPEHWQRIYNLKKMPIDLDVFWSIAGKLATLRLSTSDLIDVLPARPTKIFLFNRLVPILRVASLFTFILIIFSGIFSFSLSKFVQNKIEAIQTGVQGELNLQAKENAINNLNQLMEAYLKRHQKPIDFSAIAEIMNLVEVKKVEADLNKLKIWVIIKKEDLENFSQKIKQILGQVNLQTVEEKDNSLILLLER